ncbi:MAG: hypothetical protein Q8P86_02940 [bacterium]|nr:hypothetical protein [bacterium]
MNRNIVTDVVPPHEKRTIRNISIERGARRPLPKEDEPILGERTSRSGRQRQRGRGFPKIFIWILGIVCVLLLIFALSALFTGATITIAPKTDRLSIDKTFSVKRGISSSALGYEIIPLEKTLSEKVDASGEEMIEEKASGNIVVYNNYSTSPQRLIKNTRFEAPNGLVYRLDQSVTIPGRESKGGETIPGSLEVTVYADFPGQEYNIGKVNFTIPGFKSDAERFKGFYANSLTEMTGGFSGIRKKVPEEVRESTKNSLQNRLKDDILREARSQIPEGFVFYEKAANLRFETLPEKVEGNSVVLSEKVVFTGYIFKESDLSKEVTVGSGSELESVNTYIKDIENLSFRMRSVPSGSDGSMSFTLSGNPLVVAWVDENALKADLVGSSKARVSSIISAYPAIENVDSVAIKPFWRNTFPSDPESINVKLLLK